MTSFPRSHEHGNALPKTNHTPKHASDTARRHRKHPPSKRRRSYAADRGKTPTFRRPIPFGFFGVAKTKGFTLLERGRRSSDLKLRCNTCEQHSQVRRSVITNSNSQCKHCLWKTRFADAITCSVQIIVPHPTSHKIAQIALSCDHIVERQYGRIHAAAKGGHALGCDTCREVRYAERPRTAGRFRVQQPLSKTTIAFTSTTVVTSRATRSSTWRTARSTAQAAARHGRQSHPASICSRPRSQASPCSSSASAPPHHADCATNSVKQRATTAASCTSSICPQATRP